MPDGRRVRFTWRTLEGWYYQYKGRGLTGLATSPRADTGVCRSIPEAVAKHILALRREVGRRSVRVLIRAVERAKLVRPGTLSKSSVVRLLRAHGLSQRPWEVPKRERRAFTAYSGPLGQPFRWDLGSRSGPLGHVGAERRLG